jgi:hypothetical protein
MPDRKSLSAAAARSLTRQLLRWSAPRAALLSIAALPVAASSLHAQSTIILQGTVTASGGVPLEGAKVVVTNRETGEVRSGGTRTGGGYVMLGLQPANYTVRIQKLGFAPAERAIRLLVGQRGTLDFALQESAVELTSVKVTAETQSTFEVQRTDVSTPVVTAEIKNLPLNSRNTLNLAAIVPGIKTFAASNGRSLPAAGALPDLRFYNFYLDGVEWKSMFNGNLVGIPQTGSPVPQEALREFRVYLNPYDAEFTRGGSYIISAVTQRGTNDTQGSIFGYFQNNGLRALNFSELGSRSRSPSTFKRTDYGREQVGFNLRGPVVKNRLFYSLNYELNNTKDAIGVIPGRPAFNPGVWDQYAQAYSAPTKNHNGVLRLTAPVGDKHTLDAIYAGRYYDSETNFGGTVSREAGINAKYWVHSAQLRDTYMPTNSMVNQFSLHMLTWSHNESPLVPGPTKSYPSIVFGTNIFPLVLEERHFRANDKLTYTLPGGKHILEGGVQVERVSTSSFLPSNKDGFFDFATDTSSQPRTGTIAVGFFDQNSTNDAKAESNGWVTGVYLQDQWQATKDVTVNLGLRYDAELNTLMNDFHVPWADDPELQAKIPSKFLNRGNRKNDLNNLAPRFSFTYDLAGAHRTFLRGGWGLMYGRVPSTYAFSEKQAASWRSYVFTNPGTTDPDVLRQRVISGGGTAAKPSITLVSTDINTPVTNMWSAGVGHKLSDNLAVNLDYVDQQGRNLYVNMAVNPLVPATGPGATRVLSSNYSNITLYDDFGKASFRALTAGLTFDRTQKEEQPLRASVAYTLGFYKSNFENFGGWRDPSWFGMQSSSGDERHRVVLSGMTPIPFGFEFSAMGIVATPSRYVATAGRDVNNSGLFNDDFIGADRTVRPSGGWKVMYRTVDLRLSKLLPLPSGRISVSAEVFNAFNWSNWSGYVAQQTDRAGNRLNFGTPNGAYAPRQAQAGMRYEF